MEELLKEIEHLSNNKKIEFIKETIKQKRKYLNYLVAKKNCYYNQNNDVLFEEARKEIRKIRQEIDIFQKLKNEVTKNVPKKKLSSHSSKRKVERKTEITLSEQEINLLNKIINEDHLLNLTNFDNIETSLLDHLLSLKQKYQFYLKKENKAIKNLNKSINMLNDLASIPKKLEKSLEEHRETRRTLSKIIRYLNKLIKIEYKKINKLNREQKRITETLFAEKKGIMENIIDNSYTPEELYTVYYQLIFKDKDLIYIEKLLEEFPNLFLLKNKKRLFYQDILDKYENILLNKNYLGKSKKEIDARNELDYYQTLIIKYLNYSFENEFLCINELTIIKMEKILNLINKNELYLEKSKVIIEQLSYIKEIIKLGNLDANKNDKVTEIKGEYIFSIDNEQTKIIEDALSIKKINNDYYINFYTPDVISFIETNSILEKKAFERFKNSKSNYSLPRDTTQFFRLIQGRKKRVIGYHFVISENGNLKDLKIEKNIIKLFNNYSFEEFNSLINQNNDNAVLLKELYCLLENKNIDDYIYSSNILKSLILNCGTILGKYLNTKGIPCIYKDLSDGTFSSIPVNSYYVEFTSPLRSYISMMNQRIILDSRTARNVDEKCIELNKEHQKCKRGYYAK